MKVKLRKIAVLLVVSIGIMASGMVYAEDQDAGPISFCHNPVPPIHLFFK